MSEFCLRIGDADMVATYSSRVTYEGAPERGPTYACGGTPAEPPEFEVTIVSLREDHGGGEGPPVPLTDELRETIENAIRADDSAVDVILTDHFEWKEYQHEQAAEYLRAAARADRLLFDRADYNSDIVRLRR